MRMRRGGSQRKTIPPSPAADQGKGCCACVPPVTVCEHHTEAELRFFLPFPPHSSPQRRGIFLQPNPHRGWRGPPARPSSRLISSARALPSEEPRAHPRPSTRPCPLTAEPTVLCGAGGTDPAGGLWPPGFCRFRLGRSRRHTMKSAPPIINSHHDRDVSVDSGQSELEISAGRDSLCPRLSTPGGGEPDAGNSPRAGRRRAGRGRSVGAISDQPAQGGRREGFRERPGEIGRVMSGGGSVGGGAPALCRGAVPEGR